MSQWFETSVSYDKMMENGKVKKVTDKFLFDAISFAEAEARTIEERAPYMSGDFSVKACKRTKISEIFNMGADRYYLAKLAFVTLDEKSGMEKKSITEFLVGAEDFTEACENLAEGMKGTVSDWDIVSVGETPILEVYPAK